MSPKISAALAMTGTVLSAAMPALSQTVPVPSPSTISVASSVPRSTALSLAVGTKPRTDVIPEGTPVIVMLTQRLKSGQAKTGDKVPFEVAKQVLIGQVVVIPVGTPAYGLVESSRGAGTFGRAGTLRLRCDYLRLSGGVQVPVNSQTPLSRSGRSGTGTAGTAGVLTGFAAGGLAYAGSDISRNLFDNNPDHTTPTLIGLGAGIAAGALVGSLFRGGDVTLDPGQRLEVTVSREISLAGTTP